MDALGRKLRGCSPFLLNNTLIPAPGQYFAGELPRYFGPELPLNLRFNMTKEFHEEDSRRDLSASYSGWQLKSEVETARWRHNDGLYGLEAYLPAACNVTDQPEAISWSCFLKLFPEANSQSYFPKLFDNIKMTGIICKDEKEQRLANLANTAKVFSISAPCKEEDLQFLDLNACGHGIMKWRAWRLMVLHCMDYQLAWLASKSYVMTAQADDSAPLIASFLPF
jgi:hypothetical protein